MTAGAYALAELLSVIVIGGFFEAGRAEPEPFLAVRPLLLFGLVLAVQRGTASFRWPAIAAGIVLTLASEIILLGRLGGGFDSRSFIVQLMLAAVLAGLFDGFVQAGRRFGRAIGMVLALMLAIPLALTGPLGAAQAMIEGWFEPAASAIPAKRPPLLVVTGLPVARGEGAIADMLSGAADPAESWRWLNAHFALQPLDFVTVDALRGRGLLLLAQPRVLQPAELVAIDDWVRSGGRALVLADPALRWQTRYPLGDPRAPPAMSLLDPLLTRWGVRLDLRDAKGGGQYSHRDIVVAGRRWRLAVDDAGVFVAADDRCSIEEDGLIARCIVGQGRALLVADADLMADRIWIGEGPDGAARANRIADNGPVLGAWLDSLAGISRERGQEAIQWIALGAATGFAAALACLPGFLALLSGLFMAFLERRRVR